MDFFKKFKLLGDEEYFSHFIWPGTDNKKISTKRGPQPFARISQRFYV